MRKLLILMLIILIPYSLLFAEGETSEGTTENTGSSATLNLRGYKIGKVTNPTITITDALSSSLETSEVLQDSKIDITKNIDKFLGNASTANKFDSDKIVFSYRVAGNTKENYTLTITAGDFSTEYQESDGETTTTKTASIPTVFVLANLSYTFHMQSSNTFNGYTIQKNGDNNTSTAEGTDLTSKFSITGGTEASTPETWVHRGAVSMTIDSTEYENSPIGEYEVMVEVELVTN